MIPVQRCQSSVKDAEEMANIYSSLEWVIWLYYSLILKEINLQN